MLLVHSVVRCFVEHITAYAMRMRVRVHGRSHTWLRHSGIAAVQVFQRCAAAALVAACLPAAPMAAPVGHAPRQVRPGEVHAVAVDTHTLFQRAGGVALARVTAERGHLAHEQLRHSQVEGLAHVAVASGVAVRAHAVELASSAVPVLGAAGVGVPCSSEDHPAWHGMSGWPERLSAAAGAHRPDSPPACSAMHACARASMTHVYIHASPDVTYRSYKVLGGGNEELVK